LLKTIEEHIAEEAEIKAAEDSGGRWRLDS
jgi:hypothetical protein